MHFRPMQDSGFFTDFTVYNISLISSLLGQSCIANINSQGSHDLYSALFLSPNRQAHTHVTSQVAIFALDHRFGRGLVSRLRVLIFLRFGDPVSVMGVSPGVFGAEIIARIVISSGYDRIVSLNIRQCQVSVGFRRTLSATARQQRHMPSAGQWRLTGGAGYALAKHHCTAR